MKTFMDKADFSGTVDEVARRHGGNDDLLNELQLAVVQSEERRRELFGKRGGGGWFLVDAYRREDETTGCKVLMDFSERGERGLARRAPGRPEINQDNFSGRDGKLAARDHDDPGQSEGRKRIADLEIGPGHKSGKYGKRQCAEWLNSRQHS